MFAGREDGQASVEYAAIGVALIVVIVACAALWRFGEQGGFARVSQEHASHSIEVQGGLVDVLLY